MGILTGDKKNLEEKPTKKSAKDKAVAVSAPTVSEDVKSQSGISKLKNWVRNAVNCCIE